MGIGFPRDRNDAIDVLLGKLDEAIDDIENGRVQTIEEAWEEIDNRNLVIAGLEQIYPPPN